MPTKEELQAIVEYRSRSAPLADRDDVAQDMWVKLLEYGCLDNGVPSEKNKSYAGKVVRHVLASYYRKSNRHPANAPLEVLEHRGVDGLEDRTSVKVDSMEIIKTVWPRLNRLERWAFAAYVQGVEVYTERRAVARGNLFPWMDAALASSFRQARHRARSRRNA